MDAILDDKEIRVLGSLMEKSLATPDYYPLSLNGLTHACNQKSSRDPVVSYDESTLQTVIDALDQSGLVNQSTVGRVPKFEELFSSRHDLVPRETAILSVLLLRGPQTAGEIRSRCNRLYNFDSLEAVLETLKQLGEWGFVKRLARLAGHKESRFTQLLSGEGETAEPMAEPPMAALEPAAPDRIENLELAVDALKNELADLKQAFEAFKKEFE